MSGRLRLPNCPRMVTVRRFSDATGVGPKYRLRLLITLDRSLRRLRGVGAYGVTTQLRVKSVGNGAPTNVLRTQRFTRSPRIFVVVRSTRIESRRCVGRHRLSCVGALRSPSESLFYARTTKAGANLAFIKGWSYDRISA